MATAVLKSAGGPRMGCLNVVCLKWGSKYPPEYVNKLHRMVVRHLSVPFVFFCLTDDPAGLDADIIVLPLEVEPGLSGWWYKLSLFKREFFGLSGTLLYFDLDVVIVSNIDFLATHPGDFVIIKNWSRRRMWNSSIMRFKIGEFAHIWDEFSTRSADVISSLKGDQEWIYSCQPNCGTWPQDKVVSYKKSLRSKAFPLLNSIFGRWFRVPAFPWMDAKLERGVSVVVFHGLPNPEDVQKGPYGVWKRGRFIERHWG